MLQDIKVRYGNYKQMTPSEKLFLRNEKDPDKKKKP